METVEKLDVLYDGMRVGTMAPYQKYRTAFEYSEEWLRNGFSISPFSLPLEPGVRIAKADPFNGLFGVFNDSLPDGWGRLLFDRMLRKAGERPEAVTPLTRLAIIGASGMGALEYRPAISLKADVQTADLDRLAEECRRMQQSEESDDLDTLFALGGSSGGARPKVLIRQPDGDWIVKFPSSSDPPGIGVMEYEYAQCAKACGIEVPEVKLFPSAHCAGYFGAKRFDRTPTPDGERKVHMSTVSALLEVSHRIPALDYSSLMALTWQLTKRANELQKMFRLMCFNVFAHNRDDHSNNFTFLYESGSWRLSPAYDLTYSNSLGGEHATMVAGEGRNPAMKHLLTVAKKAGLKDAEARQIAENVQDTVKTRLSGYLKQ